MYGVDGKVRGPVHPVVVERAYSVSEASSRRRSLQRGRFANSPFEFASSLSTSSSASSFSLNLNPSFTSDNGFGGNLLNDQVANLPLLSTSIPATQQIHTSNLYPNFKNVLNKMTYVNDNGTSATINNNNNNINTDDSHNKNVRENTN